MEKLFWRPLEVQRGPSVDRHPFKQTVFSCLHRRTGVSRHRASRPPTTLSGLAGRVNNANSIFVEVSVSYLSLLVVETIDGLPNSEDNFLYFLLAIPHPIARPDAVDSSSLVFKNLSPQTASVTGGLRGMICGPITFDAQQETPWPTGPYSRPHVV